MFYFAVWEVVYADMKSPVNTPPAGMLCLCVPHTDMLLFPPVFWSVCTSLQFGASPVCISVRKSIQENHVYPINADDNTPKPWKEINSNKKKKQVTIQLQWDFWMEPCLKWTTEPFHGAPRHLVTFTVWWFMLKVCLEFVLWKSYFHCS